MSFLFLSVGFTSYCKKSSKSSIEWYFKEMSILRFLDQVLNACRHYCNVACRWTHDIRYTAVLSANSGQSCTIYFLKQPPFPLLVFSPLLSRSKEKRGGVPKRYLVSTGCSCCEWSSLQAEVLWFLFHLIHHSELSRGLCLILDLKLLGWYLPHSLSSKGFKTKSICFIILAVFSRELPKFDKL